MNQFYGAPQSDLSAPPIRQHQGGVTEAMLESMRKTRPWVLFFSILLYLGAALCIIGGFAFMGISLVGLGASDQAFGAMGPAFIIGICGVYILMGVMYIGLGLHLYRYCSSIEALRSSHATADLEMALEHQMKFWRLVGISIIGLIGLYVLIFVGAILLSAVGAMA